MGARRTEYQIVGRYMNGKEVTAYHLQSIDTGKSGRYSREQVAYLVGRDQVTNCVGQVYQDKLLLRGKGMSLEDLPVQQEDGALKNTERLGKVKRGTAAANAMEQFLIVGTIKSGRNTVGYVIQNAGCGIKKVNRKQVIELAANGKIGNARVQKYQDNILLRGVGCNLDELPSEEISTPNKETNGTVRIIALSQLYYNVNHTDLNGKFKVALVDFAVSNTKMNREQLETELSRFKEDCKAKLGHNFYNTDDVLDMNIKGKACIGTFDDPYYSKISDYMKLASQVNAKFTIDRVDFMDSDADELDAESLRKAKLDLKQLLSYFQSETGR